MIGPTKSHPEGVRRFRYMTISVHTLSVHVFSVQPVSVHWMSISVQSLSVHTKYRYSPLRYIKCQFRYKHLQYKTTSKCCSGRRCCLAISAAQMIEVCRTALFRANELDSTSSRDELRHSKQGLNRPREPTASCSHAASSCDPVITAHLCVGLSHV